MRIYGSLTNRMIEEMSNQPTPEVGMPITVCMWSDRVVYNITKVVSPKRFIVDDFLAVTLRKNGQWRFEGESMNGGAGIIINRADVRSVTHTQEAAR